ncbi:MAG: AraC family transcriptional regulator [Pseudomonadota bacterium]
MSDDAEISRRLLALAPHEGDLRTRLPGVTLMRADSSRPPRPVLQDPTIVFIAQGVKRGFLGSEVFHYQAGRYLVVSVPLPFRCDTIVQDGKPMLALAVEVDMGLVFDLLARMQQPASPPSSPPALPSRGMAVIDLAAPVREVVLRLLDCLASDEDLAVLGPQLVRELHYRVLQGSGGDCLRSLATSQGRRGPIFLACERIRQRYAEPLSIDALAREAAMSTSSFHKAFKVLTGHAPMQYLKTVRLQKAHELIALQGYLVSQAAFAVGYASASQFSREFRRWFGYAPGEAHLTP